MSVLVMTPLLIRLQYPNVVTAALITSIASLIGVLIQAVYLQRVQYKQNTQMKKLELAHSERLMQLQDEYAKRQKEKEDTLQSDARRQEQLQLILNAASIAKSGCEHIVRSARIEHATEETYLFSETLQGLSKTSGFISSVSEAGKNPFLTRDDMGLLMELQNAISKLLFKLDLDESGSADYEAKMKKQYQEVSLAYESLQDHVVRRQGVSPANR